MNNNIDSFIFDLDGTLWDATKGIVRSWNKVIKSKDESIKEITVEELKSYMGLTLDEIGVRFLPDMDEDKRKELLEGCSKCEKEYFKDNGAILYDNLEDTLKKLSKKYKLFIVSNCQNGYIEAFLDFYKFSDYFTDFECPGRTNLPKSENIKLVINRNNLHNPVYVGDTQMDEDAARKAEIPFIYASYGFGQSEKYDYVISNFEELLNL